MASLFRSKHRKVPQLHYLPRNFSSLNSGKSLGSPSSIMPERERFFWLLLTILLLLSYLPLYQRYLNLPRPPSDEFHGLSLISSDGKSSGNHPEGSCWCGLADTYCLCTPSLAIDIVLTIDGSEDIYLIRRVDTGRLATVGGFVNVGESSEHAAVREVFEETSLVISEDDLKLVGFYSDPRRDLRRHTASVVYSVSDTNSMFHNFFV
mmetsp:Transcript_30218/g.69269  ORF Transcript_30218/g.69269 Transcript_30218/m.69269 type:complete len:207 (-) Transcript_30218:685-1305(-)